MATGARQKLLFSGFITVVGTAFAEGGSPELEVSGTDATYRMTLGTSEHRFEQKKVSDAVNKVAADNGFDLKFAGTPPDNLTLNSNLQTDLEFLGKLAQNFSTPEEKWEFYARADERRDKLHFRPRRKDGPPIATLQWGADLLSFKPEVNLGNQVSKVEVHGWDEVAKKQILGVARAGQGQDGAVPGRRSPAARLRQGEVLELRFPVKSKHEADQRAAAELAKRTNDHRQRGGRDLRSFPSCCPIRRSRSHGLGAKFSTTYYVTKTVHRYDTSGYRTRFSIERPVA